MSRSVPSAGILLHRGAGAGLEVLLVHPGGPFWRHRDQGAWQLPKGAVEAGETSQAAARREFAEEVGVTLDGPLHPLGELRQAGGKRVQAFATAGDFDPAHLVSIRFELEWPPRSGRFETFPEVDAVRWFTLDEARASILASQAPFLDRLAALLGAAA